MKHKKSITILQPFIPHYRVDFFKQLNKIIDVNLISVCEPSKSEGFSVSNHIKTSRLSSFKLGPITFFNPFSKMILNNKLIIVPWYPIWPSIFILLLLKKIINRKIIIWTHGISIKNDYNPNSFKDRIKLFFFNLADAICYYTKNEMKILEPFLSKTDVFYLNNTLNVEKIIEQISSLELNKEELKNKYNFHSNRTVIYSARFIKDRRPDLLLKLIEMLKNENISFLIIGDGIDKPDFSKYENVHDFGVLYDPKIKAELFSIADFCFQPAWTGLSVVDSFAHGVPYVTLEKTNSILQCVEYNYIINDKNGFIADDLDKVYDIILNTTDKKIKEMKKYCMLYVKKNLRLKDMVRRFVDGINSV